ncbi:MAG: stage II sporulation protein P [Syntrophomonas sp.]
MRRHFLSFIKSIVLLQLFIFILITGVSADLGTNYLQRLSAFNIEDMLLPFSRINIDKSGAALLFKNVNVAMAGEEKSGLLADRYFETDFPEAMMVSNIQALDDGSDEIIVNSGAEVKNEMPDVSRSELPEAKLNQKADYSSFFQGYRVVFYCTHAAESYIPDSGRARCEGEAGLVNNVAVDICNGLKAGGLDAGFVNTLHDFPDYNNSYTRSRETVNKVIESTPNLLALFDVHRDSVPGQDAKETVEINGKKSARVLIIVGSNERKPHPHWQENLKFAEKIYTQAEKTYPGLMKGVRTKAGTYNQEYFPKSLLLEFGSDINSLAEASYAAELFADVLLEVLKEEV